MVGAGLINLGKSPPPSSFFFLFLSFPFFYSFRPVGCVVCKGGDGCTL